MSSLIKMSNKYSKMHKPRQFNLNMTLNIINKIRLVSEYITLKCRPHSATTLERKQRLPSLMQNRCILSLGKGHTKKNSLSIF